MTNSEIEKRADAMLAKYVQRGGVHKVWDKIMTGENIKYRQITTSPDFVGALTKGNNGQSYIMTNAAISNDGRRNFTIAHELGHYALEHHLHSGSLFCSNDGIMEEGSAALAIEREANHFATCLLMPEEKLRKAFKSIQKEENGMTDRIRKALGDLKARQDAGEHMPCPRCGRDTMKENIHTNALSRHADIYICDACGTEEAMLKFMSNPLPMREWASLRPTQKPSDFKTLPAEEVWKRVQDSHLPFLMNLYERWQDEHEYEDFADYRAAAFENCPGLTALWAQPFRAEYIAADETLVLRFRLTHESIEVAADITK